MNVAGVKAAGVAGLTVLLVLAAGCPKPLPPEADVNQAREALKAALDAWKEGRSPDSLRDRTPPVDFRDVLWENGGRLTKYEVKSEEKSGVSARFTVQLAIQQKDGKPQERTVVYNADIGQAVVIRPNF